MSPRQYRLNLEDTWRERVKAARVRYDKASREFRSVWGEHFEERLAADPTFAIQLARKHETAALQEYMRALKIYSDLLLRGQMPPGDDTTG